MPKTLVSEFEGEIRGAIFDRSMKYRYLLWRKWNDARPTVCFVMLNPSTADEKQNDPTITRCINFARDWGYGRLDVVNAFAYRVTESAVLKAVADPVGRETDKFVSEAIHRAKLIMVAWGNHGALRGRDQEMLKLMAWKPLHCLGMTAEMQPRHPLYLPKDLLPVRFDRS